MQPKRITIVPDLHGKITRDGKLSEPDIYYILEKWLERHPVAKERERDIRISRSYMTLPGGFRTDLVGVSMVVGDDIEGYDPTEDLDLYEYFLSDDQGDREPSQNG